MHYARAIFGLLLATGLAGCGTDSAPDHAAMATGNSGQLQLGANKLVLRTLEREVVFASGSAYVGDVEKPSQPIQSAVIIAPVGDDLRAGREQALSRWLRGQGVRYENVRSETSRDLPARTYHVTLEVLDVVPPPCPNWSSDPSSNYTNLPFSPMGCTTVSNIGQMVADPTDLVYGKGDGNADAVRSAKAVEAYYGGSAPATGATAASPAAPAPTAAAGTSTAAP